MSNGRPVMALQQRLDRLPANRFAPGGRAKLARFAGEFDRLWRIEPGTKQAYAVEEDLRDLLQRHWPKATASALVSDLRGLPDSRFLTRAEVAARGSRLRPARWHEAIQHVTGTDRPPPGSFDALGLGPGSSVADIRRAVSRADPRAARSKVLESDRIVAVSRELLRQIPGRPRASGREATTGEAELGPASASGAAAEPGLLGEAPGPEAPAAGDAVLRQASDWDRFWHCFLITLGFWAAIGILGFAVFVFLEVFLVGAALAASLWMALEGILVWIAAGTLVLLIDCICRTFRLC